MENLTPAERMYKNHLQNVSNYQKRNRDKMRLKHQSRMIKLKENPEEYEKFKEKAKQSCKKHRENKKKQKNIRI